MRDLLRALWLPARGLDGAVTVWLRPPGKEKKGNECFHLPLEQVFELTHADEEELRELAGNRHVYFGYGLRRLGLTPYQQGGKKDTIALIGACVDLDFRRPGAHKADNLPENLDEAVETIDHLPDPSAIVFTGNGAQIHWFFRDAVFLDSVSRRTQIQKTYKAFYETIQARAEERGWHQDMTFSVQHVFRLPGFLNRKNDTPVTLEHCVPSWRYDPSELGIQIPARRGEVPKAPPSSPPPVPSKKPEPEPADEAEIIAQMRRVSPNKRWYKAIQAALKGESFANRGERDVALQGVCATIAWLPAGRKAKPQKLAEILRPSLAVWAAEKDADKTLEEELEKAADKIARSQEDYWDQQARVRPQLEAIAKRLGFDLNAEPGEEDGGVANDFILQHAIIQYRSVFFVFCFSKGEYLKRPFDRTELPIVCRDAWKEAPEGVSIHYTNSKGEKKTKTVARLCEEYGTVAIDLVADMTINESEYDRGRRLFREAIARMVITEAAFDGQVDEWLRLLAGPQYEKLLDWIAAIPKLEEPNSALYLEGFSGAGKGLLASGLARIWTESGTPTKFTDAIGQFNAPIIDCPLVWIDESLPMRWGNVTGELRALVGASSLSINQKGDPIRPVNGAARLMICANNEEVLMSGDADLSMRDLEAVVGRILHIHAREEAVDYLADTDTRGWVDDGVIAKHCLWLAENRKIKRGKRFLVEGEQTEMHRRLMLQGDTNGLVYEWLVRFATNPRAIEKVYQGKKKVPLASLGKAKGRSYEIVSSIGNADTKPLPPYEILVNNEGVVDCWKTYMPEVRPPMHQRIGRVLARLSHVTTKIGPRGDRVRYHVIKPDMILEWCRQNQIGNEDAIAKNLGLDLDELDKDECEPARGV